MSEKKLYTVREASNLSIDKIHQLYKEFINPNQTDIYKSLPFGNDVLIVLKEYIYFHQMEKKF